MEQKGKNRKQQAMETRQRIFIATTELINEKGVENVLIEDISRRANVSMGLFYRYYANVYDVMAGVQRNECNSYYMDVREKYLVHDRGEEKIIKFVEYVADYHKKLNKSELTHSYVTAMTNDKHRKTVASEERGIYLVLKEGLDEMKEDGVLKADVSINATVRNLCILIRGIILEYIFDEDSFDIRDISKHMVGAYLKGIK